MLTKEDLKKIEELLQPKFDHIELRLDAVEQRLHIVEGILKNHDKKFAEIERRLDNIVEVVALHTTLLKDINLRLISVEGNVERMSLSIENIWSKLSLLSAKIKVQEDKTNTFNMLLDKGKDRYK
jgi:chromosome segregation ATPase